MNEDGGEDCFPLLQQSVFSNEVDFSHNVKSVFEEHLSQLINWFEKYFQEDNCNAVEQGGVAVASSATIVTPQVGGRGGILPGLHRHLLCKEFSQSS